MENSVEEYFNQQAPNWNNKCKYNIPIIKSIINVANIRKTDRILDIACGTGILSKPLSEKGGSVVGIDISKKMIEIARKNIILDNVSYEVMDFLKSESKNFDIAILHNAYPHFFDKVALAKAIWNCLREDGRFIIAHSLSRDKVNLCHNKIKLNISIPLKPVKEESKIFSNYFTIDVIEDNDDLWLLSGRKK